MKSFKTERRQAKISSVLKHRQPDLKIIFENISDPHNLSAILRTCDAAGIPKVSLLYYIEPFPKIGKKSSASAFKWIEKEKFTSVDQCYETLRKDGFSIYASSLTEGSVDFYELDLTKKIAIVVGNEHRGLSDEATAQADKKFYIPMYGMVQSLNVSVASAVVIYEAMRQRRLKGLYDEQGYTENEMNNLLEVWNRK
jgi:tRNA (guanosine-2'-O-)-methyltransferase